jgi:hypothetical protein
VALTFILRIDAGMKTLPLPLVLALTIIASGCGDSIGPSKTGITVVSARLSAEHIDARTIDSVYRLDQVQAQFLNNADITRPFTVDSVIYNGAAVPLVVADSGLYRMKAPSIASIVPGAQQRFHGAGNATFPGAIDSILQPADVHVTGPVAGAEVSLLQGIPISWTPLGNGEGKSGDLLYRGSSP